MTAGAAALLLAACSPRFDWREIRQPQAGFVVALPDRPQNAAREISFSHPGGALRAEMTMLSTGVGSSLFAVGTVLLPSFAAESPQALQATLDWFGAGLLRNIQAPPAEVAEAAAPPGLGSRRLKAAQAFSAAGRTADGRAVRLAVRLYVVDDRLYQLTVLGADGEIPPPALEMFFDSFRLAP